ncbi:MAG: ATP-binding cassette domain-containing protein [Acidimicrobiaceae bacterium]|nr:ATP-binding cassette domain-containing protein [Acidimicrobiaceae bacterium]
MNGQVTPLVESRDLSVHFTRWVGSRKRTVYALDDFSIAVAPGETVGLVGESGCGKSTAGRALLGAVKPTKGQVFFEGRDVTDLNRRNWRAMRKQVQMIFQDPYSALNPKIKIRDSIAEPFLVHTRKRGAELDAAVGELLEMVGMTASAADKYPHAFSGGQRQRIVIARALALHPGFVGADEATAALDVSIQAQIVNLLVELKDTVGLSYLFISHNLAVVRHVSDRVAIMYLGHLMEIGSHHDIYENPTHPYSQALLSAVPVPDPTTRRSHEPLKGDLPSPMDPPKGCRFNTRCPLAVDQCFHERPPLTERSSGHLVACWVN